MIEEWSVSNFLNFNIIKCNYMIVSRKQSPIVPPLPLELFNSPMQRVDCCKYLGLLITNNLTWSAHISSICSNAKKILGLIYRRFYTCSNKETLKQLYISLVRAHLEYACHRYYNCYNCLSSKLLRSAGFTSSLAYCTKFSTISVTFPAFPSLGVPHVV